MGDFEPAVRKIIREPLLLFVAIFDHKSVIASAFIQSCASKNTKRLNVANSLFFISFVTEPILEFRFFTFDLGFCSFLSSDIGE